MKKKVALLSLVALLLVIDSCSGTRKANSADEESVELAVQENQLFYTASNGTDQEFINYIEGNSNISQRDDDGQSVLVSLYECTSDSRLPLLRALSANGFSFKANVDYRDARGLELIVSKGLIQDLEYLRQAGVSLARIDSYRRNAVRWFVNGASSGSRPEGLLDSLLRDGCLVSTRDEFGITALDQACTYGKYSLAIRLFKFEREEAKRLGLTLEPSYYTRCGTEAAIGMPLDGDPLLKPLLRLFLGQGMDIQEVLLACCDYRGNVEGLRIVLQLGADPNKPGSDGVLPLFAVADADKAGVLIEHGARIDGLNAEGHSALTKACVDGNAEIAEVLLSKGAGILQGDGTGGVSDLSAAFDRQCYGLCVSLLDAGADPHKAFSGTANPLARMAGIHDSFWDDGIVLARRLIAAGFRLDEPDDEGITAIYRILAAGDEVPQEVLDEFIAVAGPETVAATRAEIDRHTVQTERKDLLGRFQWNVGLIAIAILMIVLSIWLRESYYKGSREKNWFGVVSALLGLAYTGIAIGGGLGLYMDSQDHSTWLRLPVFTILGMPAGLVLGGFLFLFPPIRRQFNRFAFLYYIPVVISVILIASICYILWK
ncbi:MAG TPA: hypothetical protein PKO22_11645 [Treponemataceae bacterium]|nr:hypothetical protein [Treponemataceae bacterium]